MTSSGCDVIVVGAGNAALCAALAAAEAGASVIALERAPAEERGGNSRFTEGSMRFAFNGVDDLLRLMPELSENEKRDTDFGNYPEEQFFDDLAKVRGTRFNTGDGLRMALEAGALPYGNWSGCHTVAGDLNAPNYGDITLGDAFQKHSYPFGVLINAEGRRFFDEGADFRMYTYVKCGHALMQQPQQLAWQVFDRKVLHLLREEYRLRQVTKIRAGSLEELARKLEGVNKEQFLRTIAEFNAAVQTQHPFDPNSRDGRCTVGLAVNKSNWANPIDEPPFEAYAVACGITFTFGGIKVNKDAQVIDTEDQPIRGLYAAGEMVGGLFYSNYPGGSGLMSGAVFGRIAGNAAARAALAKPAA